nr:immunoglobulin heavy chain junction region [Macaca mulatta]
CARTFQMYRGSSTFGYW